MRMENENYHHKSLPPFTILHSSFSILHPWRRRMEFSNLQRMGPPPFKESMPRPHSLKIENGVEDV